MRYHAAAASSLLRDQLGLPKDAGCAQACWRLLARRGSEHPDAADDSYSWSAMRRGCFSCVTTAVEAQQQDSRAASAYAGSFKQHIGVVAQQRLRQEEGDDCARLSTAPRADAPAAC